MTAVINEHNFAEYVWRSDSHYTAKGYRLFAEVLFKKIMALNPSFWGSDYCKSTSSTGNKISSNILHLSTFKNPE